MSRIRHVWYSGPERVLGARWCNEHPRRAGANETVQHRLPVCIGEGVYVCRACGKNSATEAEAQC